MFLKACSNMVGGIIARFGRGKCDSRLGRSGEGTGRGVSKKARNLLLRWVQEA